MYDDLQNPNSEKKATYLSVFDNGSDFGIRYVICKN